MKELENVRLWLMTYPQWDGTLEVDYSEYKPACAGLYPQGLEEIKRREDVLGNVQVECRYRFVLYRHTAGQQEGTAHAQWLLDFQNWVQQQSAVGLTPRFGDVPARERMQAVKGKWENRSQVGMSCYVVTLVADFIKIYEE